VKSGVYMIGQGNMGLPVFCDFESEQNYVVIYLHPHHLNDIQEVNALFDVNTEVVIRHILTTGVQCVTNITQFNSFFTYTTLGADKFPPKLHWTVYIRYGSVCVPGNGSQQFTIHGCYPWMDR